MSRAIIDELKKTIVFLGDYIYRYGDIKRRFIGTGFLIEVEEVIHLVTAKHVITDKLTNRVRDELIVFYNLEGGGIGERNLKKMMKDINVKWIEHKDKNVDVIIIPFDANESNYDYLAIDNSFFKEIEKLDELTEIFYLSYQPGILMENRIMPIIRTGIISLVDKDKRTIYLDGFAFPGNSGSPVFIKPYPFRMRGKKLIPGLNWYTLKFIGVIGLYIPYIDYAISQQTGHRRVAFEENTGIAEVYPYDFIQEIINLPEFQKQLKRLREMLKIT